ncbi:MAG: transcription elongation factor GreA [Parcubacteria group bacterium GW2011_GWE2_39_37]|nr:MAG: transcription elongation factor GreA [Parcubacteria group bacterium GW2011_GWE2_39_37]
MTDQIISQDGYDKLKQELELLTKTKRQEIARRIQTAKDMGDLSENAEYSEAKDAQAFNEGRIAEIEALLKNVTVVNGHHKAEVGMGSIVTVKVNNETKKFTIVSFNEVDPLSGKISNESPLGRAFLHKKKGDKLKITTPKGEMEYEITNIE